MTQGSNFNKAGARLREYNVRVTPVGEAAPIQCQVYFIDATSVLCRASAADLDQYRNSKVNIEVR